MACPNNSDITTVQKTHTHELKACPSRIRRETRERASRISSDGLVLQYISLVKAIAWQIFGSLPRHASVDLNDILQAGHLGLVNASRSYRADFKVPFASYARHRIRGEILDSLRKLDTASRNLRLWQRRIESETHNLALVLGREPSDEEISTSLGVDVSRLRKKRLALWHSASCSVTRASDQNAAQERDAQPVADPAEVAMPDCIQQKRQLADFLRRAVAVLPPRSQKVILDYYLHNLTMKQIGHMLQINESRVSQIHKSALHLMARALRASGIRCVADI